MTKIRLFFALIRWVFFSTDQELLRQERVGFANGGPPFFGGAPS